MNFNHRDIIDLKYLKNKIVTSAKWSLEKKKKSNSNWNDLMLQSGIAVLKANQNKITINFI